MTWRGKGKLWTQSICMQATAAYIIRSSFLLLWNGRSFMHWMAFLLTRMHLKEIDNMTKLNKHFPAMYRWFCDHDNWIMYFDNWTYCGWKLQEYSYVNLRLNRTNFNQIYFGKVIVSCSHRKQPFLSPKFSCWSIQLG